MEKLRQIIREYIYDLISEQKMDPLMDKFKSLFPMVVSIDQVKQDKNISDEKYLKTLIDKHKLKLLRISQKGTDFNYDKKIYSSNDKKIGSVTINGKIYIGVRK